MTDRQPGGWSWAISRPAAVYLWTPVVMISLAHVATPSAQEWLHDVYRRLYYIPIILGGFLFGVRGGVLTALLASLLYLPHAFFLVGPHAHHHGMLNADPTGTANKILELVLYHAVGLLTGLLVERERQARRLVEQKMIEMQAMEQHLIRAGRLQSLGEMTAGLAHEIRNPLASLKTAADIVADEIPESSPRRKMVTILRKEIDRLAVLLERFLAFARPGSLTLVDVSLPRVVKDAIDLVEPQARVKRVAIDLDGAGGSFAAVRGDTAKLTQVVLNLLLNAVQFSPEGGRVTVRLANEARPHGAFVMVSVRDQGPGIPKGNEERIFDPFFSTRDQGSGLGLSIASRLMDEHHGAIEVLSPQPSGVEFRLLFPA